MGITCDSCKRVIVIQEVKLASPSPGGQPPGEDGVVLCPSCKKPFLLITVESTVGVTCIDGFETV